MQPIIFSIATFLSIFLGGLFTIKFKHKLHLIMGFFAGFLLYIGASDILPEAHSKQSSFKIIGLTLLGVIFIFIITRFV